MSDLNDLIARSSVIAFNSGLRAGINQERKRILALIEHHEEGDEYNFNRNIANTDVLKEVINEEDN